MFKFFGHIFTFRRRKIEINDIYFNVFYPFLGFNSYFEIRKEETGIERNPIVSAPCLIGSVP